MISYYTSVMLISWLALGVLSVLIRDNDRLAKPDKSLFYLTYAIIAVSALAEWCGIQLDGRENMPKWALVLVKCLDYILTPMASVSLVAQMRLRNRWQKALLYILVGNALLQIVSAFTGWMVIVDEAHHYHHGPLYFLYMIVGFLTLVLIIVEFIVYGRSFRRQNRNSLYAIMVLLIAGIVIQEILPSGNRVFYITLTIGMAMMFIHYSEYSQLAQDDTVTEQQMQIDTDAMTGLYSRSAYSRALEAAMKPSEDFAAFTIDINGLKQVNDGIGHEAGDELICGAAACIARAFAPAGRCYRTGGDEFVVLAHMGRDEADNALRRLEQETQRWQGSKVKSLSVSAGCALAKDHEEMTAEELVMESDKAMYAAKEAYYRNSGADRRRRR